MTAKGIPCSVVCLTLLIAVLPLDLHAAPDRASDDFSAEVRHCVKTVGDLYVSINEVDGPYFTDSEIGVFLTARGSLYRCARMRTPFKDNLGDVYIKLSNLLQAWRLARAVGKEAHFGYVEERRSKLLSVTKPFADLDKRLKLERAEPE